MNTINNITSPNFGMALKIKPKAKASLAMAPLGYLEALKSCGEKLKDSKDYDLLVDSFGHHRIYERKTGKSYDNLEVSEKSNYTYKAIDLSLMNSKEGLRERMLLSFPTEEDVFNRCNDILWGDDIRRKVAAILAIEASNAYLAEQKAEAKRILSEREILVKELLSDFGQNV